MSDCMTQEDAMNMNNEQAVSIFIPLRDMMRDQHGCPISDAYFALDKAIEALKQPTQPNTSNALNALDCVSRQAAIDTAKRLRDVAWANWKETKISANMMIDALKDLPSAQPEITQEVVELYCRQRCLTVITNELFTEMKARWSAQPGQKKGKWIGGEAGYCTCCGHEGCASDMWDRCEEPHCPNCGAEVEV